MTKQEKIQEAYGQHWDKVKFYVDENGLIDCKHFIDFGINIPFYRIGFNFRRPKSLQGIEDNNGWIKIESEDDLPKENHDIEYYVIDALGTCRAYFNFTRRKFQNDEETIKEPTHYKPIEKQNHQFIKQLK